MTWTRLSDDFYDDDTINDLSHEAFRAHIYALVWCNKQLTDGRITRARVRRLLPEADTDAVIAELVDVGLWERVGPDELQVDWTGQERADDVQDRRALSAERNRAYRRRKALHAQGDHSECDPRNCLERSGHDRSHDAARDASRDRRVTRRATPPVPTIPVPTIPDLSYSKSDQTREDDDGVIHRPLDLNAIRTARPDLHYLNDDALRLMANRVLGAAKGSVRDETAYVLAALENSPEWISTATDAEWTAALGSEEW